MFLLYCLLSRIFFAPILEVPRLALVRYRALARTPTKTQIWLARIGMGEWGVGGGGKGTEDFSVSFDSVSCGFLPSHLTGYSVTGKPQGRVLSLPRLHLQHLTELEKEHINHHKLLNTGMFCFYSSLLLCSLGCFYCNTYYCIHMGLLRAFLQ